MDSGAEKRDNAQQPAGPPEATTAAPAALPSPLPVPVPLPAAPGDATLAPVELQPRTPGADAARPAAPAPAAVPAPAAGGARTFGRYEIQQEIASGGMGRVYLARDPQLDRTVALKTLLSDALVTPAQREQFLAEARNAAKLHHPHIVPIHDVGTCGNVPYFTMDVIDGQSLAAALPDLALREFLAILRDVAAALHVAHEAGFVHRDVKPANILLDAARCAFVTDFGVALKVLTRCAARGSGGRAAADAGAGTLHYMAPEQARADAGGVDRRADVWALGVILYQGLTGRRPFDGASGQMVVLAILDHEPVPPSAAAAEAGRGRRVHRDLDTICLKCLAKDRARRYATAAELAAEIGRFLDGEPILARQEAWWEKGQRWVGRRKVLSGVLLALAVAGVWAVMQQRLADIAKRAQATAEAQREAARRSEAAERDKRIEADQEALRSLRKTAAICLNAALAVRRRGGIMREVRADFLGPLEEVVPRAIARGPKLAEPHYHLGRMYRALLEFDKAAEEQDRALAKEPDYGPSLYERGVLFAEEARRLREEKRSELLRMRASGMREERIVPEVPTDEEVERAYPQVADLKRCALANLTRAASLGESQPDMAARSRAARGMAAVLEGSPEADRLLSESLKEDKQLEEVHAVLAERAAARGDWEEAARRYEQGWRVDLGYVPHVVGLGDSLRQAALVAERQGRDGFELRGRGRRAIEVALGRDSGQAVLWEVLATQWLDEGKALCAMGKDAETEYQQALEASDKALAINPNYVVALSNQAVVHKSLGDAKRARGAGPTDEYRKALASYDCALAMNPNFAEAANGQGNVYWSLGDAKRACGADPTEEYHKALAGYDRALVMNPMYAWAAGNQAAVYESLGDAKRAHGADPTEEYRRALASYDRALAINPNDADVASNHANLYQTLGEMKRARGEDPTENYLKAMAGYDRALAINPKHADAANNQALVYTSLADAKRARGADPTEEYRKALVCFDRALTINPNDAVVSNNQATVYQSLGDAKRARGEDATDEYRKALGGYDRALAINRNYAPAANNQANVYHSLGDAKRARGADPTDEYRKALGGYDRALAINPNLAAAAYNQANVYQSLGDARRARGADPTDEYRMALTSCERALAIKPNYVEAANEQAIIWQSAGDAKRDRGADPTDEYRRALACCDRALAINSNYAEAASNQASVYRSLGDHKMTHGEDPTNEYRKALAACDRALRINPGLWQGHAIRGLVMEGIGQAAEAVRAYEAALAIGHDAASACKPLLARARAAAAAKPTPAPQAAPPWLAAFQRAAAPIAAGDYAAARPALEQGLAAFAALPDDDRTRLLSPAADSLARHTLRDAHYNLACVLALAAAGRDGPQSSGCDLPPPAAASLRDAAFDHLRAAMELGFSDAAHLAADTDLAPLHPDPRWSKLLESIHAR